MDLMVKSPKEKNDDDNITSVIEHGGKIKLKILQVF
jgi:hypothetical protein